MKKKKVLIITIFIVGLIMVGLAIYLLAFNKEEKPSNPKEKNNTHEVNIEKDPIGKAMIYVAENNNYTTENYLIDVEQIDNNYVVTVKTKDEQLVETITIDSNTLQTWQPNNSSPEGIEAVTPPNSVSGGGFSVSP